VGGRRLTKKKKKKKKKTSQRALSGRRDACSKKKKGEGVWGGEARKKRGEETMDREEGREPLVCEKGRGGVLLL